MTNTFEYQTLYANADSLRHALDERLAEWDRNRGLDASALLEAADLGLTGIEVPKYLGGLGFGFRQKVRVAQILSRSSMAFAFALINTQNVTARLAEIGCTSHKRDLLPELLAGRRVGSTALTEPGAGSDFAAIATTAQPDGNGWILNGEKAWITNAAISDVIICYAQTDPSAGRRGIASFMVDAKREGFERLAPYELTGGHIIGTGRFRLNNYRAEGDDLLTEPGDGFGSAMSGVNGARIYVAAMCCSMVHSALGIAVEYGSRRTTFGKTLLEHQGLSWSLASVANQLEAAQLMTERAIEAYESDEMSEVILAAAHAKKFVTEMAEPAIAACIQAMGAEGLRDRHPLGRHLADARLANFVDGSTEIQTERIARSLTTHYRTPVFDYPEPEPVALTSIAPQRSNAESAPETPAAEPPATTDQAPTAQQATTIEQATTTDETVAAAPVAPIRSVPPLPPDSERTNEPDGQQAVAPDSEQVVTPAADSPPLPPDSLRTDRPS